MKAIFTTGDYYTYRECMDMGTIAIEDELRFAENAVGGNDVDEGLRLSTIRNLKNARKELDRLQREVWSRKGKSIWEAILRG